MRIILCGLPCHLNFLVVASEKEKHHLESEENVRNWLLTQQPPNSGKEDIKMPNKGKSKLKKKVLVNKKL